MKETEGTVEFMDYVRAAFPVSFNSLSVIEYQRRIISVLVKIVEFYILLLAFSLSKEVIKYF